jgi:hypothetical protein
VIHTKIILMYFHVYLGQCVGECIVVRLNRSFCDVIITYFFVSR